MVDEAAIRGRTRALLASELVWEDYWDWLRRAQGEVTGDARLLLYQCIGPIDEFDGGYRDDDSLLAHLSAVATGTYRITDEYRARLARLNGR